MKIVDSKNIMRKKGKEPEAELKTIGTSTHVDARLTTTPDDKKFPPTPGATIDTNYAQNYNAKIVADATALKIKYCATYKFSDEYYLQYAEGWYNMGLTNHVTLSLAQNSSDCPIQDLEWAGYSYEEILEMDNNGYKVPDDVLMWAHAQQESDVTAYEVITDEATTDDNSSTEEVTGDKQLASLQKKAKGYVTKSEDATSENAEKIQEFSVLSDGAQKIKNDNQSSYKDKMKEIDDYTQEWKKLDEKGKTGQLSDSDKKRYAELGKILNGKNGTLMKEVMNNQSELDDFLKSMNGLSSSISKNTQLAQDTRQAGVDLANYERGYNEEQITHSFQGIVFSGNGLLEDVLYGASGSTIQRVAIDTSKDLTEEVASTSKVIEANVTNKEFAQEYTTVASDTENKTKNAMGSEFDKSTNESGSEKANKDENKSDKGYNVNMIFTAGNSKLAALTTVASTASLIAEQVGINNSGKKLNTEMKKSETDVKNLTKETSSTESKHNENLQEEEVFLAKLDELQQDNSNQTQTNQEPTKPKVDPTTKNQQQTSSTNITSTPVNDNENKDNSEEVQSVVDNISQVKNDDDQALGKVNKLFNKTQITSAKYQNTTDKLQGLNGEFISRNANALKVAQDTLVVGTGTFALSFGTTALGNSLVATGTAMMASPFTYGEGLAMALKGYAFQYLGMQEFKYGTLASVVGATGIGTSLVANTAISDTKSILKTSLSLTKSNSKIFEDTGNLLGIAPSSDAPSAQQGATGNGNAPLNSEQTPEGSTQTPSSAVQPDISTRANVNSPDEIQNNMSSQETSTPVMEKEQAPAVDYTKSTQTTGTTSTTSTTDQTSSTSTTEDTSSTQTTEDTSSTSTTSNTQTTQQDKKNEGYQVDSTFSAPNAIKATATTLIATTDLLTNHSIIEKSNDAVLKQIKKNTDLAKTAQNETQKVASSHQQKIQESAVLANQFLTEQQKIQNAVVPEEVEASQNKIENLTSQISNLSKTDDQLTSTADKAIQKGDQQMSILKGNTSELGKESNTFDKKLSNQLDVSAKTLGVGIGTSALGLGNFTIGNGLMTSAIGLMSNPLTFNLGVAQSYIAATVIALGVNEQNTGLIASATGTAGIATNAGVKITSAIVDATGKASNAQYKLAENLIKGSSKLLEESIVTPDQLLGIADKSTDNNNTPKQQESFDKGDNQATADSLLIASASTNITVKDSVTTDDKTDKKLTRFNNDSAIESKKKSKKVTAISAATGGSVNS